MAAQSIAGARRDIRRLRRDRNAAGVGQRREERPLPLRRPPVDPVAGKLDGLIIGLAPGGVLRRDFFLGLVLADEDVGEGMQGDSSAVNMGCS